MFWEIASLILQATQLGLYLSSLSNYEGKLQDLATWLCDTADDNRDQYILLRDCDPDFYAYYQALPDRDVCESAIDRGKGSAWYNYGAKLRRAKRTTRGFNQMSNVQLNYLLGSDAVAQTGLNRVVTTIKEKAVKDDHILERWSAIVGAPIGVERYYAGATSSIIQESFRNLKSLGQGFNSAGAAFGNQLYRILN